MRKSSIADVLFSSTRQRLLSALLVNFHQPVYATELANHLGVRPSTLQRDLARLTEAGILKMSRNGNRTYFQANEQCPVLPDLRALLIKTSADALPDKQAPLASPIPETSGNDFDVALL